MSDDENNNGQPSCIICLGPALHPVRLTCECKFTGCAECLFRWLHSKPQTVLSSRFSAGTCPTCRKVGVDPMLVDPETGSTEPLTLGEMAKRGESGMVNLMVALGANWRQSGKYGTNPLSAAAGAGQLAMVKMLVEQFYTNVDAVAEKGDATAFLSACENGHLEVAEFLLSKGANCMKADDCWSPFSAAASRGHLNILKLIEKSGKNFDFSQCLDDDLQNPLHEAVTGSLEVVQYLTDPGNLFVVINKSTKLLESPEGVPNKDGETPLLIGLYGGHRDCAEYLLNTFPKKCRAGLAAKDGTTTVIAAAVGGLYDIAKRLATEFGVDPKCVTKDGETAATAAIGNVSKAKPEEVDTILDFLKFLAANGVDLAFVNEDGENLLHLGGALKLPICRYLVEEVRLSPWGASNDTTTPLYVVYNNASKETEVYDFQVIAYLEEQCRLQEHPVQYDIPFSDDLFGDTYLHLAVKTGSVAVVQYVLHQLKLLGMGVVGVNKGNENKETPLHEAVGRETHDIVSLLLREGANPNLVNDEGQSCLHLIAGRRDGAALEMMGIFMGYWGPTVGVFLPDSNGRTILHEAFCAAKGRHREMRNSLKKICEDPSQPGNPLPPSPEEVAQRADDFSLEVVKYLLCHPQCTPEVLKHKDKLSGFNILHEVVSCDDPITLRFLLKHLEIVAEKSGETVEAYNVPDTSEGNYPLHIAAEYGYFFVSKILLDRFPDTKYQKNKNGKYPAQLADEEALRALLK